MKMAMLRTIFLFSLISFFQFSTCSTLVKPKSSSQGSSQKTWFVSIDNYNDVQRRSPPPPPKAGPTPGQSPSPKDLLSKSKRAPPSRYTASA
ncbi:hypothetical protein PRUPE_3G102500 [Prunus persica]|uniref:Uncharacterized protein n=1 Tax=Prunus persica TaxID=3760 RepID=A0A251PY61_PRUPE|nr:hypothetical protein PRUPE_3G102500 [Prunus persica]